MVGKLYRKTQSPVVRRHSFHQRQQTKSELILAGRRITFDELQRTIGLGRGPLYIILNDLKIEKVCAHWAPQNLTQQQKQTKVDFFVSCLNLHIHPTWLHLTTFSSTSRRMHCAVGNYHLEELQAPAPESYRNISKDRFRSRLPMSRMVASLKTGSTVGCP